MTPGTIIGNYLLLHLGKEFPGLDVWRANVVGRKPGVSVVAAGEPGQADLTGVWGGRCKACMCAASLPVGRSVWIEVKAPGDSQFKTQRDFEHRVTRLGALYIICKVRRKETVEEIRKYKGAYGHHPEIQAFFDELRTKL